MAIRGRAYLDRSTKKLLLRLPLRSIAILAHEDLDPVAAQALLDRRILAVINTARSVTGKYINRGPGLLLRAGVPILDQVSEDIFVRLRDGQEVELRGNTIFRNSEPIATGTPLTLATVSTILRQAEQCLGEQLDSFIKNTMVHALNEKDLILSLPRVPPLKTCLKGRQVVVVVRGTTFREDLKAILPYIRQEKPVLVAVDGGADALLEQGLKPHVIIGDMDSVSDKALSSGAELVVHAYPDGSAPGLKRLEARQKSAKLFPVPGTSEDAALLLAYHSGCELIVLVGSHSHMLDFLEKGRPGMASTFLVRLLVGSVLVDAKGVNQLYKLRLKPAYLLSLLAAGILPTITVFLTSLRWQQLVWLWTLKLRLLLGW
ncbi:MAG: putative cytokinetic ring protein SteA [bacterium]|jgi:uncharacterized membrane-anchored protein